MKRFLQLMNCSANSLFTTKGFQLWETDTSSSVFLRRKSNKLKSSTTISEGWMVSHCKGGLKNSNHRLMEFWSFWMREHVPLVCRSSKIRNKLTPQFVTLCWSISKITLQEMDKWSSGVTLVDVYRFHAAKTIERILCL